MMQRRFFHVNGPAGSAALALVLVGATLFFELPRLDAADPRRGGRSVILATTTSTQDSGLLDALLPAFEAASGVHVKTVAVGTGAALALGARGEADVLLVHAPEAESRWMDEGRGDLRLPVMHNEFVIVGPAADPASVRATKAATGALAAIARQGARWVSRDDGSGTDLLEKRLWKECGHPELAGKAAPASAPWYLRSGQGMGATLAFADARRAYTLTDRGTLLAWRAKLALPELVRGDSALRNRYHVITVRAGRFPPARIHAAEAEALARWLTGPAAQHLIATYGVARHGEPLFVPDAVPPGR